MKNDRQWLADLWAEWAFDIHAYFETRTDDGWVRAATIPYNPSEQNQWRVVHPKKKEPKPRPATAGDLAELWKEVQETDGKLEILIAGKWVRPSALGPRIGTDLNRWRVVPKEKLPLEIWANEYQDHNGSLYYGRAYTYKKPVESFADSSNYIRTIHFVEVKE